MKTIQPRSAARTPDPHGFKARPGFDAGVILPNFNDGFDGTGPDIGAHEFGKPAMQFGAETPRYE